MLCVTNASKPHKSILLRYYFVNTSSWRRQNEDTLSRYTLRVEQALLDKLGYIAEYEGRTKNRELEQMIKKRIAEFEKEHGEIQPQ